MTYNFGSPAVASTITAATSGGGTLSVIQGGALAGTGTVNLATTVNGGTIRGGIANGTTVGTPNYGTLTFGTNGLTGNQTILGGSTIFSEVNRTVGTPTGNTFSITNGAAIGNASLINVSSGVLNLGSSGSPLSSGNHINIVISDTAGTSLVGIESYTFTLVTTSGGINLNGGGASSVSGTIDSGTTGLGANGFSVSVASSTYTLGSWTLSNSSGNLVLSIAPAVAPEPAHVLLLSAGALLVGLAFRRRWQKARAASVA
jgi:hypothetical protein